jgi:hypothetical protein
MFQDEDFFKEYEQRLVENKRLMEARWLPVRLAPITTLVGRQSLPFLLFSSLLLALLLYWHRFGFFIEMTKLLLWL